MNEINITRLVDTAKLRPFHLWLAFWCLLAMMASGFAMSLASRARSRLAQLSLAAGCCLFCAVYLFTR